jgi:D-glycero-D-manno-heptose 1,7-bisphosphate phosphatase
MSLYIFDKDGTLIQYKHSFLGFRRSPFKPREQVLIPGVFEKLACLRAAGHSLALASNQEVVALGIISLAQAEDLMENCAAKVGGVVAWKFCPCNPLAPQRLKSQPNPYACDSELLKPKPGMVQQLMTELGFSPADTVMVGDTLIDRKCARAAQVAFRYAPLFFSTD